MQFPETTLDLDSTVITRSGNQEGSAKGYTVEATPVGDSLRMLVAGENLDGKFVEKTVMLPLIEEGSGLDRLSKAGLETREEDGKILADNVVFGSAAQDAGLDLDWEIKSVQVENKRPPKHLIFIPAFILLGFVGWLQRRRQTKDLDLGEKANV